MNWDALKHALWLVGANLVIGFAAGHLVVPRVLSRLTGIRVRARDPYIRAWKRWRERPR